MEDQRGRRDFRRPAKVLEAELWRRACDQTSRIAVDTSSGLFYNAPYLSDVVLLTSAVATQEHAHEAHSTSPAIDGCIDHSLASLHPFSAKAPTPHPRLIPFRAEGIGARYNRRRTRKSPTSCRGIWPMHSPWSALPACRYLHGVRRIGHEGYQSPRSTVSEPRGGMIGSLRFAGSAYREDPLRPWNWP